jgi:hypothetical protein
MKNNIFPLWLSPVLMGVGTALVYTSSATISYTPPNASLNTLLTGELIVPAQIPVPGSGFMRGLGFGAIGLGLTRLGTYAFGSKPENDSEDALPEFPVMGSAAPPGLPPAIDVESVTAMPDYDRRNERDSIELDTELQAELQAELQVGNQAEFQADSEEVPTEIQTAPTQSASPLQPIGAIGGLVEALTNESMPQHVAIAGIPRSGKTCTLRGIIWGIGQVKPHAQLWVIDPKNSPGGWLGLEKHPDRVRTAHHSLQPALSAIDEAIAWLDRLSEAQDTTQKAYLICDDWSDLLEEAQRLDAKMLAANPQWASIAPDLLYKMGRLAAKGLEYGIHLVLATQSCACEEFGFSPQLRHAFQIAALGRKGRYEMLLNLLKSEALIPDDRQRHDLAQLTQAEIERVDDLEYPILVTPGDRYISQILPDLEWVNWVDLSIFEDAEKEEAETLEREPARQLALATAELVANREWERLLLESTPDQINRLIDRHRHKPAEPDPNAEASMLDPNGEFTPETFLTHFPDTSELDVFAQIQAAVERGETSASRLIKSVLKCGHTEKYREIGKPCFKYLVRKYGSNDLLTQFKSYLEK